MIAHIPNLPAGYLKPGHIYMSEKPVMISAVLGSSISTTMFSPEHRVGAACHSILPEYGTDALSRNHSPESCIYVDYAIETMINKFTMYGIRPEKIEVRLFGGADIFVSEDSRNNENCIGKKNIEKALNIISIAGLNMVAFNSGGHYGRKMHFYTHTGKALLLHLETMGEFELFNMAPDRYTKYCIG
jgi:chemotaxis protein CheD